jgi:hypothetical protein
VQPLLGSALPQNPRHFPLPALRETALTIASYLAHRYRWPRPEESLCTPCSAPDDSGSIRPGQSGQSGQSGQRACSILLCTALLAVALALALHPAPDCYLPLLLPPSTLLRPPVVPVHRSFCASFDLIPQSRPTLSFQHTQPNPTHLTEPLQASIIEVFASSTPLLGLQSARSWL